MKKYLFIVLMIGYCYPKQQLIYIYTKDGTLFKSPIISQITDSTIFLSSHNISLPLNAINKLLVKDLNKSNSYIDQANSFVGHFCMSIILGYGVAYVIAPKSNNNSSLLRDISDLIYIRGTASYTVPATFLILYIAEITGGREEIIDMNEWSKDGKMKFFKQYKLFNSQKISNAIRH